METGVKTIIAGVIIFIIGVVVIPVTTILPIILAEKDQVQFIIPGSTQFTIKEPGNYYLWNDYVTIFNNKSYNRSEIIPDGIEIKIKNFDTDEPYNFVSNSSMSSSNGNNYKNSIGYIKAQGPVTIDIEITGGNEERVFSFSKSDFMAMFGLIFGGIAGAMLVGFTGIGIVIWGIVKLVKSDKKDSNGNFQGVPKSIQK